MQSFRHIPAKDMRRETFLRHITIVIVIGFATLIATFSFSLWLNVESGMRSAQQEGVQVQMALSRIGESWYGQNRSMIDSSKDDGSLELDALRQVLAAASENGIVHLYDFDTSTMQATRFSFDDGAYLIEYDSHADKTWTVTSRSFFNYQEKY